MTPHRVDVRVSGHHSRQFVGVSCYDVERAAGQIRGIEHLIEVGGGQGMRRRGHGDHPVAQRQRGCRQRDQAEQGCFRGTDHADHADRFIEGRGNSMHRRLMHRAVIFVGPGGVGEQPLKADIDLSSGIGISGHRADPRGELGMSGGQVFRDIVEDLSPVMAAGTGPAGLFMRGLHGIADILAAAGRNLAQQLAADAIHGLTVAAVRPGLPAADIMFGSAVDAGDRNPVRGIGSDSGN